MKGIITFIIFCLVLAGVWSALVIILLIALVLAETEGVITASNFSELEWYWGVGILAYFILSLKLIYKLSRSITHKIFELLKID